MKMAEITESTISANPKWRLVITLRELILQQHRASLHEAKGAPAITTFTDGCSMPLPAANCN